MRSFFLFLSLTMSGVGFAQSQVDEPGWIRLGEQIMSTRRFFDAGPNSHRVAIRTNAYYITGLAGEVALRRRLRFSAYLPLVTVLVNDVRYVQTGNTYLGGRRTGLGDVDFGIRYVIRDRLPFQLSGTLTLGIPTGHVGDITASDNLQTGDGEFNQLIGIQVFQPVGKRISLTGRLAFNNRTKDFSNEIRYGLELAYGVGRLKATARLAGIESLFNREGVNSLNGLYSNHRELVSPGLEISYSWTNRWSAYASVDIAAAGRNTLAGSMLGGGLHRRLARSKK